MEPALTDWAAADPTIHLSIISTAPLRQGGTPRLIYRVGECDESPLMGMLKRSCIIRTIKLPVKRRKPLKICWIFTKMSANLAPRCEKQREPAAAKRQRKFADFLWQNPQNVVQSTQAGRSNRRKCGKLPNKFQKWKGVCDFEKSMKTLCIYPKVTTV